MKRLLFFLFIILFAPGFSIGQDGKEEFSKILQSVLQGFNKENPLSFNIRFTFAYEDDESDIIDSLSGEFKIYKGNSWSNIDNTINIVNKQFSISIFPEDEIIYLIKLDTQSIINSQILFQNSALLSNLSGSIFLDKKSLNNSIVYSFEIENNPDVKLIRFIIDNESGRLLKIIQHVNSRFLQEPHGLSLNNNKYAIITAEYFNYSDKTFDLRIFNSDNYFSIVGEEFIPSLDYRDYFVFKAN